jgi:hypothetical protein
MPKRRPQFVLPEAVDDRLERLLELVRAEGNQVSRSDIVATLIWQAQLDGDVLGFKIRQYRKEVTIENSSSSLRRSPGPRPLLKDPLK